VVLPPLRRHSVRLRLCKRCTVSAADNIALLLIWRRRKRAAPLILSSGRKEGGRTTCLYRRREEGMQSYMATKTTYAALTTSRLYLRAPRRARTLPHKLSPLYGVTIAHSLRARAHLPQKQTHDAWRNATQRRATATHAANGLRRRASEGKEGPPARCCAWHGSRAVNHLGG